MSSLSKGRSSDCNAGKDCGKWRLNGALEVLRHEFFWGVDPYPVNGCQRTVFSPLCRTPSVHLTDLLPGRVPLFDETGRRLHCQERSLHSTSEREVKKRHVNEQDSGSSSVKIIIKAELYLVTELAR